MRWHTFPHEAIALDGLPWWRENQPFLYRLPLSFKSVAGIDLWCHAKLPSGARLRFGMTGSQLGIKLYYDEEFVEWFNTPKIGKAGVSVWVDNKFVRAMTPEVSGEWIQTDLAEGLLGERKEVVVHLGPLAPVRVQAIGTSDGGELSVPRPYRRPGKIVWYGQCVEQGIATSRPGMAYTSMLSRALDMDFVNLGFGSYNRGQLWMADLISDIEDMALCVITFAQGFSRGEDAEPALHAFMQRMAEKRPDVPMVCTSPLYQLHEFMPIPHAVQTARREAMAAAVAKIQAQGANVRFIDGLSLLGPHDADTFVERYHPGDIGHARLAERLAPILAGIIDEEANNGRSVEALK